MWMVPGHTENCAIWICDITTFPEYSGSPLPAASHVYITQLLFKSALHISILSPEMILNTLLLSKETDFPVISGTCHHIPALSPLSQAQAWNAPCYLPSPSRLFLPFKTSAPTASPYASPPPGPDSAAAPITRFSGFSSSDPHWVGLCLVMNVSISVPQRL